MTVYLIAKKQTLIVNGYTIHVPWNNNASDCVFDSVEQTGIVNGYTTIHVPLNDTSDCMG